MRVLLAIVTVLLWGAALYAAWEMVHVDLRDVQALTTDLATRPVPLEGNRYVGLMGVVMLCAGTAMLTYKWSFGFKPMQKYGELAETAVRWTSVNGKVVPR